MDSPDSGQTESRTLRKQNKMLVSSHPLHLCNLNFNYHRRPLRTYSKRPSSTDTVEPISKRRRIEESNTSSEPKDEAAERRRQSSSSCPSPTLPPSQPIKKGSIMSYFKVVQPMPSSSFSSPEPTSGPIEPISTPPSSPPMSDSNRKKRRRLTTRIISRATSNDPNQEDTIGDEQGPDDAGDRPTASANLSEALLDADENTLNRSTKAYKEKFEARKQGRNKKDSPKPSAIQTTLSLSISEKGFTECKECNMLYNPLHKQDAKCHARRHAAMLKAKSTILDNELSD